MGRGLQPANHRSLRHPHDRNGSSHRHAGVTVPAPLFVNFAAPRGIVGAFYYQGTAPLVNLVTGGAPLTENGAVTFGADWVSLIAGTTSAADLVSALAETTAFTTSSWCGRAAMRLWPGPSRYGSAISAARARRWPGARCTAARSGKTTSNGRTRIADRRHGQSTVRSGDLARGLRLIGMKTDGTTYTLSDYTNNVFLSKTGTGPRAIGTNPMLVGNYYNSTRQGPSDHAATFHYSVAPHHGRGGGAGRADPHLHGIPRNHGVVQ